MGTLGIILFCLVTRQISITQIAPPVCTSANTESSKLIENITILKHILAPSVLLFVFCFMQVTFIKASTLYQIIILVVLFSVARFLYNLILGQCHLASLQ
jgi:hypothetical protein